MQFGVFYEHQLPKPWSDDDEFRLLRDALDQVELADRLGFDYAWEVEHHFLDEYSHSSAPEVFLAAAAARTSRIRLGHGIRQVIPNYNHPARTAGGPGDARPDLGRSRRVRHRRRRHPDGVARLRHPRQAQAGDVARSGRADRQHDGARALSRLRVGELLAAVPQRDPQAPPEAASADVDRLHQPRDDQGRGSATASARWRSASSIPRRPTPGSTSTTTSSRARSAYRSATRSTPTSRSSRVSRCTRTGPRPSGGAWKGSSSSGTRSTRSSPTISARDGRTSGASSRTTARPTASTARSPRPRRSATDMRAASDRPPMRERHLRQMSEVGVDQVIFIQQAGRNRHDDICASLELFAAEVLPEFAAHEPERQARKQPSSSRTSRRHSPASSGCSRSPRPKSRRSRLPSPGRRRAATWRDELSPMNTAELLLELYGRVPPLVHDAVEGLDADQLHWQPAPQTNTIGWLVWHLTRVEDHHIAEIIDAAAAVGERRLGRELRPGARSTNTGYGHTPDDVSPSVPPAPRR